MPQADTSVEYYGPPRTTIMSAFSEPSEFGLLFLCVYAPLRLSLELEGTEARTPKSTSRLIQCGQVRQQIRAEEQRLVRDPDGLGGTRGYEQANLQVLRVDYDDAFVLMT